VRRAEGELMSFLTDRTGTPILVSGWAADSALWGTLDMTGGETPPEGPQDALAGTAMSRALGLAVGGSLDLDGLELTIVGQFRAPDPLFDGRLITHLKTLQRQMFRDDTVTIVHVTLDDPRDADALQRVTDHVRSGYPGLSVRSLERLSQDNIVLSLLEILRTVVVWTVAIAGFAGTANIMLMAASERSAEIGLLVAIGWSSRRILSLFLVEALILATAAGIAGLGLGWAIIELVSVNATLAAFLSDSISPWVLVQALVMAMAIGALAGIAPALRVLSIPADRALRSM
jgi:putative ABC transport system permease protein